MSGSRSTTLPFTMSLGFEPTPLPVGPAPMVGTSSPPSVYISGPMSGYVGHNYQSFHNAAVIARESGWEVESPAEAGVVEGWEWHEYMQRDLDMLHRSHAIALLPGWEGSEGACIELIAAIRMGLDVHVMVGDGLRGELKPDGNLGWDEGEEAAALAAQASRA